MGIWTLEIPGWQPTALNHLMGSRGKCCRLKKADREMIGRALLVYAVPPATGRRRVTLTLILGPGQRAADPDAYWKSLLDALTAGGGLRDDNRQSVQLEIVRFARGAHKASYITLEDMP